MSRLKTFTSHTDCFRKDQKIMDAVHVSTLGIKKNLRDVFAYSEGAAEIAIHSEISGLNQFINCSLGKGLQKVI